MLRAATLAIQMPLDVLHSPGAPSMVCSRLRTKKSMVDEFIRERRREARGI